MLANRPRYSLQQLVRRRSPVQLTVVARFGNRCYHSEAPEPSVILTLAAMKHDQTSDRKMADSVLLLILDCGSILYGVIR
jgi:hypothetical protein